MYQKRSDIEAWKRRKGGERHKGRFPATVYFPPKLLQLFAAANRDGDPTPSLDCHSTEFLSYLLPYPTSGVCTMDNTGANRSSRYKHSF
jgi:hypothetical protein